MSDPRLTTPDGSADPKKLIRLVELLYASVADPGEWRAFLDEFTSMNNGAYARLWRCDGDSGKTEFILNDRRGFDYARDYNAYYHLVNPVRNVVSLFRPGLASTFAQMFGDPLYKRTEYWDGLHKRNFIDDEIGVSGVCEWNEQRVVALSVVNELGRGPFDEEDKQLCAALGPHFATAARLMTMFSGGFGAGLLVALEAIATAVMAVDLRGRLLEANVRALSLMASGMVDLDDDGRPAVGSSSSTRELHAAIAAVIATACGEPVSASRHLSVDTSGGPVRVFVAPFATRSPATGAPRRGALIFITSRDEHQDLQRLTPAQRAVADRLGVGATIDETARDLDVSPETVRTHLKAVYRKLGIASRAELARLLADA